MGALISEAVRYYQLRTGEVVEGINGKGDNANGEAVKDASPLEDVIGT